MSNCSKCGQEIDDWENMKEKEILGRILNNTRRISLLVHLSFMALVGGIFYFAMTF